MYILKDYFQFLTIVDYGGSTVFEVKEEISEELIENTIKTISSDDWYGLALEASDFMGSFSTKAKDAIIKSAEGFKKSPI